MPSSESGEPGRPVTPSADEPDLRVGPRKRSAGGVPAVVAASRQALAEMGPVRSLRTLLRVNQVAGFDCPGCAWPEPEHRSHAEFCENGAKAVAEEATRRRVTPEFFAEHPLADLATRSDRWLGSPGPTHRADGAPGGERPLPADQLGGELRPGRPGPGRPARPRPRRLLHLGADQQRGGVPLPAVRAGVRHQQPPGLLEHVPRVELGGPLRDPRGRQGQRHSRRRRAGRPAHRGRPEPGDQPSPDADRPASRPRPTAPASSR